MEKNDIYIRALKPEDWEIFRDLRIRAVRENPGYFLETVESAESHDESHWRETLDGQGKQVFGLFDGKRAIGLTAIFTWREDPIGRTAVLAMSHIDPDYRGRGLSHLLYESRITWAKTQPQLDKIVVSHREGNEASRHANQAFGFVHYDTKETDWPDGRRDREYLYVLDLNALRRSGP